MRKLSRETASTPRGVIPGTTANTYEAGWTGGTPTGFRAATSTYGGQTTVAVASSGVALPTGTINVASTSTFDAAGTLYVVISGVPQTVTYTGKTATSFTGCSGGSGTMTTGDTVRSGSVGVTLPTSTINVLDTTDFPSSGMAWVTTVPGTQLVTYTGKTATTLTGCTGGTGAMLAGGTVRCATLFPVGMSEVHSGSTQQVILSSSGSAWQGVTGADKGAAVWSYGLPTAYNIGLYPSRDAAGGAGKTGCVLNWYSGYAGTGCLIALDNSDGKIKVYSMFGWGLTLLWTSTTVIALNGTDTMQIGVLGNILTIVIASSNETKTLALAGYAALGSQFAFYVEGAANAAIGFASSPGMRG